MKYISLEDQGFLTRVHVVNSTLQKSFPVSTRKNRKQNKTKQRVVPDSIFATAASFSYMWGLGGRVPCQMAQDQGEQLLQIQNLSTAKTGVKLNINKNHHLRFKVQNSFHLNLDKTN